MFTMIMIMIMIMMMMVIMMVINHDDHDKSRYGEEEGNFHIIIVNDDLEEAYVALRFQPPVDDDHDGHHVDDDDNGHHVDDDDANDDVNVTDLMLIWRMLSGPPRHHHQHSESSSLYYDIQLY